MASVSSSGSCFGSPASLGTERFAEGLRQEVGPGGVLKVCSDKPHLVSLGGGRLSTAVTLLPIEEGSLWLGSGEGVDIQVEGTGVEDLHCRLENVAGTVTLHPNAPATSVDGIQVTVPTRLTQGCMICIGRSNFFRFNHPAEAQLIKSILPNARISGVPMNFITATDNQDCCQMERQQNCTDQKPPLAPRNGNASGAGRWRDAWEEGPKSGSVPPVLKASNTGVTGQTSSNSHKVFLPGSATTTSPAADVLGLWRRCVTPPASLLDSPPNLSASSNSHPPTPFTPLSSQQRRTLSAGCDLSLVGESSYHIRGTSEPPPINFRMKNTSPLPTSPLRTSLNCSLEELNARKEDLEKKRKMVQNERLREQETQRREQVRLEEILNMCAEYERQVEWEKEHETDQPRSCAPRWNTVGTQGGSTPWQQRVSASSGGRRSVGGGSSWEGNRPTPSPSPGSSTTSANSSSSSSASSSCPSSSSSPPAQQMTPIPSSPTTPSVHQNRIKTNGSLPRDKRLQSSSGRACSPVMQRSNPGSQSVQNHSISPEEELNNVFSFEANSLPVPPNSLALTSRSTNSLPRHFGGCSRGVVGDVNGAVYQCNSPTSPQNSPSSPTSPSYPTYPQSPRTRIRTIAASVNSRGCCESENRHISGLGDSSNVSQQSSTLTSGAQWKPRPLGGTLPRSAVSTVRDHAGRNEQSISLQSNGYSSSECVGTHGTRGKPAQEEAEELKRERGKLLVALAAIRRKMNDIERQREEALRELEMEQALLEGELSAVTERVLEEEARVEQISKELEHFEQKIIEEREMTYSQVSDCQRRVEEASSEVQRLEDELVSNTDPDKVEKLREQLKNHQELLEAERKAFEDMEFHQLEREASWEASREEMSREVSEVGGRGKSRRHRMEQLERAREQAATAAKEEGMKLKGQQELLISRLEEGRHRLKIVEKRLNELSRQGVLNASWECSPDGSSDADESPTTSSAESNPAPAMNQIESILPHNIELLNGKVQGSTQRKQSQDDLDRISRVTSGAPIDVSNGGSLGRRTLESLRTIERNRQIHLVQQGSQVIEEERRRVEELKRRAQDEVRAKWEEERLRHANQTTASTSTASTSETCSVPNGSVSQVDGTSREKRVMNCRSLNSVGSEEDSSIAGSDVPTESASSEDGKCRGNTVAGNSVAAKEKEVNRPEREMNSNQAQNSISPMARPKEQDNISELRKESNTGMRGGTEVEGGQLNVSDVTRPVSDGSECEDQLTPGGVRMRSRTASSSSSRLLVQQQRPLTRYLPIRGEQLDLRAHVEWAGHQPDLCPHVDLTATTCKGHLLKAPASLSAAVSRRSSSSHSRSVLSGFRGGSWSRRWFVFDRAARCFSYYTDASEKKTRGGIDFEGIEEVYVDHLNSVKSPSPRLTFCVKTRERTFHLVAPSAEAMRIWVDVIFTGAEGYTQFDHVS